MADYWFIVLYGQFRQIRLGLADIGKRPSNIHCFVEKTNEKKAYKTLAKCSSNIHRIVDKTNEIKA